MKPVWGSDSFKRYLFIPFYITKSSLYPLQWTGKKILPFYFSESYLLAYCEKMSL